MKRIADWWFAPAPAERLAALRVVIGLYALVYLWRRFGEFLNVANLPVSQFQGVGLTKWSGPLPASAIAVMLVVTIIALIAFVAGALYRYAAPIAALGLLFVTTYRNSWGMVFHTENLLVLHIVALAFAPAADVWSIDARYRAPRPHAGYGWAIKLVVALTAATYMLAGIAKLRIAGFGWVDGALLRNQIAIDNLRKVLLGDSKAVLATPFLEHPSFFTAFCALTLMLELGAGITLVGGWPARIWALAVWGFHLGVVLLMNIWFIYPLSFVAFLPVFPVEKVILRAQEWRRRRRG
jgi:hypothetical protein